MACKKKYFVFLGVFLINFPNGMTWYYGNLSSYATSSLRYYLGPSVDVETVWILSVFIGLWTTGLMLGALFLKLMPRPRLVVLIGILVFDGAFVATSWTIRQSLFLYVTSFGALTGLADGFIYSACMAFIPMWEQKRVGLVTAVATSGLGVGALFINQIISRYVNPENKVAATPDGKLTLFSQEEIVTRVPNLLLILAGFNFFFHIAGLAMLRTKPVDGRSEGGSGESQHESESQRSQIATESSESGGDGIERKTLGDEEDEKTVTAANLSPQTVTSSQSLDIPNAARGEKFHLARSGLWRSRESLLSDWPGVSDDDRPCCIHCLNNNIDGGNLVATLVSLEGTLKHSYQREAASKCRCLDCEMRDQIKDESLVASTTPDLDTNSSETPDSKESTLYGGAHGSPSYPNQYTCSSNANPTITRSDNMKHEAVYLRVDDKCSAEAFLQSEGCACYGSTNGACPAENLSTTKKEPGTFGNSSAEATLISKSNSFESTSLTPRQMVCTRAFYVLWVAQLCMDYSLSVLTNFYKLYGELYIRDDHFLAFLGTTMTASMIVPKLVWGMLLDRWGIKTTLVTMTSSTAVIASFWYFTAQINRWLYSLLTLGLCWCVCAFDSLAAAAVLVAFGPAHYNINYGLVASSSLVFNMVSPIGMKGLLDNLGWAWLFLSVAILNFIVLLQSLFCINF